MNATPIPGGGRHRRPRRRVPAMLWLSCVAACLLLTLTVGGTLSGWTQAMITNNTNTVATAAAVILRETGPDGTAAHGSQTCFSSASPTNSASCATINKYGGTTSPLTPGSSQSTDVTFTNVGTANASQFQVTPGACSQAPAAGTGTPPAANVCTGPDLTVSMSCENGSAYNAGDPHWTTFAYAGSVAGFAATLTQAGVLAAGASATCRFTVALSATASVLDSGVSVSQPLTWTLTQ